jgi:hypothetical protein
MRDSESPVVQEIINHILEHVEMLRSTDPGLLAILNEQPLGPAQGTPPNPGMSQDVNQSMPPDAQVMQGADLSGQLPNMPQPAQLPAGAMPPPQIIPDQG